MVTMTNQEKHNWMQKGKPLKQPNWQQSSKTELIWNPTPISKRLMSQTHNFLTILTVLELFHPLHLRQHHHLLLHMQISNNSKQGLLRPLLSLLTRLEEGRSLISIILPRQPFKLNLTIRQAVYLLNTHLPLPCNRDHLLSPRQDRFQTIH